MNTTMTAVSEYQNIVSSETVHEVWNLKDIPEELFWDFVKFLPHDFAKFLPEKRVQRPPNYCNYMRKDPVYQHTSTHLFLEKFMDAI